MPDDPLAADLTSARHEAASEDGLVTAVVDGSGVVVDLRLDPRAMRLPSMDLAAQAVVALQAAQRQARLALKDLVTTTPAVDDLTALATGARTRLDEMTTELSQLLGRLGGPAGR